MEIKSATLDDAAAIAEIYNQGIEDRIATLETQLRAAEERASWLAARGPRHPVIVVLDPDGGGAVAGWGSLNPFNPRSVYEHVADISVYVRRDRRSRGVGRAIVEELERRARGIGYH